MMQDTLITPEQMNAIEREDFQPADPEISLVDVLGTLLRHKKFILRTTLLLTAVSVTGVFLLPPSYKAEATILPPQQQQSSLSALMSSAMGGLATSGMASQLGLKTAADLYIGILKSRTIGDDIVDRFHLQQVYHAKRLSAARAALTAHTTFASGKDSLITISVKDHDPHRAADLANAFIDELHKQNSRLAVTDASQRRLFFEQQLEHEKDALANAEIALKSTEQATGLLAPSGQAEALLRAGAQLRAEIVSREVELQAMRSYATDENPRLQVLKKEIAALQAQLGQIESSGGSASVFEVPANRLPAASLEYVRKMRDLKYHETLYELIAKQYEGSRIDEAKQAPLIQVVDRAVVPDKDSRPSRVLLSLVAAVVAFVFSVVWVLAMDRLRSLWEQLRLAPEQALAT